MNTIILVGPPDRHKRPLCLCKSSDCSWRSTFRWAWALQFFLATSESNSPQCRCNVLTNVMQSTNVVTYAAVEIPSSTSLGNPGGSSSLIELAISCTICFVSFFEPVAIASTQASSVGVTVRYRRLHRPLRVINCIHALRKNNNIVTMPTCDALLRHFWKTALTDSIRGCTLLSTFATVYTCLLQCLGYLLVIFCD